MKFDLATYTPQPNGDLHYIQNDSECPLPVHGPRVTVGFWVATKEELEKGPECSGEPAFTITYPVGRGEVCYPWKHMTSVPADPMHPNSAKNIVWKDGWLKYDQYLNLECSGDVDSKFGAWVKYRDAPPELFGRILSVCEIPVDRLREECIIQLQSRADGRYVSLDRESVDASIWCDQRQRTADCDLTVMYPGFVWNEDGGSGDDGEFALVASNGRYLQAVTKDGKTVLKAAARKIEEATLFSITLSGGGVAVLMSNGQRVGHTPPGSSVALVAADNGPYTQFTVAYR